MISRFTRNNKIKNQINLGYLSKNKKSYLNINYINSFSSSSSSSISNINGEDIEFSSSGDNLKRKLQEERSKFSIVGESKQGKSAYLDFQATTPLDPRVLDIMLPYMTEQYGNPHSRTHMYGWSAEEAVEKSRQSVASLINANAPIEVIFTSGATESNNIAIKGVARFFAGKKKHVITTQTEHKCVLDSCRQLEKEGFNVTYLPVQTNGLIDLQQLRDSIREDTSLVSIMGVQNEVC